MSMSIICSLQTPDPHSKVDPRFGWPKLIPYSINFPTPGLEMLVSSETHS